MGFYVWMILLSLFIVSWLVLGGIGLVWYVIQRCRKGNVEWASRFLCWMTISLLLFRGCGHKVKTAFVVLFSPAAVFSGLLLLSVWLVEAPWKMKLMNDVPVVGKQINRWVLRESTGLDFPLFDVKEVRFQDNYPDYQVTVKLVLEDSPSKKNVIDTIKELGGMKVGGEQLEFDENLWVDDKGNLFYSYMEM